MDPATQQFFMSFGALCFVIIVLAVPVGVVANYLWKRRMEKFKNDNRYF